MNRSKHWVVRSVACAALVLSAGCAPVDVEGHWVGSWHTSLMLTAGDITLDLSQDGEDVSGSFDLSGTLCVGSGSVDGGVDGRRFAATLSNTVGGQIDLDGNVNAASDRINGDFVVTGGLCQDARGSFEVDLH